MITEFIIAMIAAFALTVVLSRFIIPILKKLLLSSNADYEMEVCKIPPVVGALRLAGCNDNFLCQ